MTTVTATAPVRTCDCGGWTDTWFARYGSVFHVAVDPGVRAVVRASSAAPGASPPVTVNAENYGDRYAFRLGARPWVRHPLIEAAIESAGVPPGMALDVSVYSAVPPGASTGTSAAVCVALLGAMRALQGMPDDPGTVAAAAHAVEVDWLGQQSGLQDQLAAAYGGIGFIEIREYPAAERQPVHVSADTLATLEARLLLVYLGRTHSSSAVHEEVIRGLREPGSSGQIALDSLRRSAGAARDAVVAADWAGLGDAMVACTEGQRRLHPSLVGADAQRAIDAAAAAGAIGWKVNGAGGEGGSLAILCPPGASKRAAVEAAILGASPSYQVLPTTIARAGLHLSIDRQGGPGDRRCGPA